MALKIQKTIWLGQSQIYGPGKEKELFKVLKTKKERQPLIDRGLLVEEEDAAVPDPDPEETTDGEPWKGKK
jgi:hypothetical protein